MLSDDLDSDDDEDDLSPDADGAKQGGAGNPKSRRGNNSRPHGPVINKWVNDF